jgi:hypothetical protein
MFTRRDWLRVALSGAAVAVASRRLPAMAMKPTKLTVYKSPTCGCCHNWVEHMKTNGFAVEAHDVSEARLAEVKDTAGVPSKLRSCHIALAGVYAFEGHVPADLVTKVVTEKPKLVGLAVPRMPVGSPGMEVGNRRDPYAVVAFTRDGKTWVYANR